MLTLVFELSLTSGELASFMREPSKEKLPSSSDNQNVAGTGSVN